MPSSVAGIKTTLTFKVQRSPSGNEKPPPINCGPPYSWISKEEGLQEIGLNFFLELPPFLFLKKIKGFWTQFVAVDALEEGSSCCVRCGFAPTPLLNSFTLRLGLKPNSAILFPVAPQRLAAVWARLPDQ